MVTDGDKTAERRAENKNCHHPQVSVSKEPLRREKHFYYGSMWVPNPSEASSLLANVRSLYAEYPQR